jgi:hypothetical protein
MTESVRFDTKIVVVVRDDLATWQKLNVTAFLAGGIAGAVPGVMGEAYRDADGTGYLPMFRQPVLVMAAGVDALSAAHARAVDRGLDVSVFTDDLFATGYDTANREAVAAVPRTRLRLAGIGIHGPRNAVDRSVKGARLHD